jgi:hypothetical protein
MGLETASFISGLTASWPVTSDKKAQGDDHLRLIKSVLQSTFPGASRAFYFPTGEAVSGTQLLDATDMNNTQYVDTTSGNIAMTLPTLSAADKGWSVDVMKVSGDTNAVIVSPPSGSINAQVGAVATIRVGAFCEPAKFTWNGTAWYCYKPGVPIGTSIDHNGSSTLHGYLLEDGSSFSNTAFAELFAALGSSTLNDIRGRTKIGQGTGSGLTARTQGANYGAETHPLTAAEIPSITSAVTVTSVTGSCNVQLPVRQGGSSGVIINDAVQIAYSNLSGLGNISPSGTFSGSGVGTAVSNNTSGGSHNNIQPSTAKRKIIRAC